MKYTTTVASYRGTEQLAVSIAIDIRLRGDGDRPTLPKIKGTTSSHRGVHGSNDGNILLAEVDLTQLHYTRCCGHTLEQTQWIL